LAGIALVVILSGRGVDSYMPAMVSYILTLICRNPCARGLRPIFSSSTTTWEHLPTAIGVGLWGGGRATCQSGTQSTAPGVRKCFQTVRVLYCLLISEQCRVCWAVPKSWQVSPQQTKCGEGSRKQPELHTSYQPLRATWNWL